MLGWWWQGGATVHSQGKNTLGDEEVTEQRKHGWNEVAQKNMQVNKRISKVSTQEQDEEDISWGGSHVGIRRNEEDPPPTPTACWSWMGTQGTGTEKAHPQICKILTHTFPELEIQQLTFNNEGCLHVGDHNNDKIMTTVSTEFLL